MGRKQDIIDAAISLFAERGFLSTPTSAVAKKAGVAEGLIFHYFSNKQGILTQILLDLTQEYTGKVEELPLKDCTGLESIEKIIYFNFWFTRQRSSACAVLMHDLPASFSGGNSEAAEVVTKFLDLSINRIRHYIEIGKKDGSIKDVPVKETAYIIRGLLDGVTRMKIHRPMIPVESDLCEQVVAFCRSSLRAYHNLRQD